MTVLAICMTALSGFLLGFILGGAKPYKKADKKKISPQRSSDILSSEEYLNFLNYDGTAQI